MNDAELQRYGRRLFERRVTATIVPPARVRVGAWQPTAKDCHLNVTVLCSANPRCRPVRGWIVFDFGDLVRFNAHSMSRLEDGAVYDITPVLTERLYPFLPAEENDADYCDFIAGHIVQHVDYDVATGRVSLGSAYPVLSFSCSYAGAVQPRAPLSIATYP